MGWASIRLLHGLGNEQLKPLEAARDTLDGALLFVYHETELFDESLQVRVASFHFGEALIIHPMSLATN